MDHHSVTFQGLLMLLGLQLHVGNLSCCNQHSQADAHPVAGYRVNPRAPAGACWCPHFMQAMRSTA